MCLTTALFTDASVLDSGYCILGLMAAPQECATLKVVRIDYTLDRLYHCPMLKKT